jgi:hypothetical protein
MDVSGEHVASIFRVFNPETTVDLQWTISRYTPEDINLSNLIEIFYVIYFIFSYLSDFINENTGGPE